MYSELEKILLSFPNKNWDFKYLSMNPNISLQFIENNPQFQWNYYYVSEHPKLTPEFITKNKDKRWNLIQLASNKNLSIEYILNNIEPKYWSKTKISSNLTLTIDILKKHLHIDWHWHNLTLNPSISINDISDNTNLPWGVQNLAYIIEWPYCIENKLNKHLKENIDKLHKKSIEVPYNIEALFYQNDNFDIYNINRIGDLTLKLIKENIYYPWDFKVMSDNTFDYEYKAHKTNIIKKWYKQIKLSRKLWAIAEILIMEQMKPEGIYMQRLMESWN